jgi:hypothetical protein
MFGGPNVSSTPTVINRVQLSPPRLFAYSTVLAGTWSPYAPAKRYRWPGPLLTAQFATTNPEMLAVTDEITVGIVAINKVMAKSPNWGWARTSSGSSTR